MQHVSDCSKSSCINASYYLSVFFFLMNRTLFYKKVMLIFEVNRCFASRACVSQKVIKLSINAPIVIHFDHSTRKRSLPLFECVKKLCQLSKTFYLFEKFLRKKESTLMIIECVQLIWIGAFCFNQEAKSLILITIHQWTDTHLAQIHIMHGCMASWISLSVGGMRNKMVNTDLLFASLPSIHVLES